MTIYAKRFNAQRAARAALGKDANEGVDFVTTKDAAGAWGWAAVPAPAPVPAPVTRKPRAAKVAADGTPIPPDFSAPSHRRWRTRLAECVALAEAGDLAGLRAFSVPLYSSSPKAIARYRDRMIAFLEGA